jgi:hypothetical protein
MQTQSEYSGPDRVQSPIVQVFRRCTRAGIESRQNGASRVRADAFAGLQKVEKWLPLQPRVRQIL